MEDAQKRLFVALDFPTWPEAERVVKALPEVQFYKVGLELYLASRGEAVDRLRDLGKKVFVDLKFHDIPNTVAAASRQVVAQGAYMLNVHGSGGREMMTETVRAVREEALARGIPRPLLVAVTVLTSLNDQELREIGLANLEKTVESWAKAAQEAGLDGVVASPREITLIRQKCGPSFKIVCPGVRPRGAAVGDQKRFTTPGEAIKLGADFLVVGRPITRVSNPREASLAILEEMAKNL
jgi:orotidine-5'-phosphate decarboxylase